MKFGSVCSGIEAASVAWESLGFEAQWFSEIEHFPSEVLKYRYPTVPNLGDMTKLTQNETFKASSINLLVGGTPCQSFSVAGLRGGLADPRGNLMLGFLALADAKKPRWIVWENVPGVLSSNGGKDFATFLGALGKLGYGFAYRVLDAQYFGVAQRRRRVFVVGYLGDWRPAAAVLFERESLSGDSKPSRKKGKETPTNAEGGVGESSDVSCLGGNISPCVTSKWKKGYGGPSGSDETGNMVYEQVAQPIALASKQYSQNIGNNIANPLLADDYKEPKVVAQPISIAENTIGRQPMNGGNGDGFTEDGPMYTLNATGVHGVAQPIAAHKVSPTITAKMQGMSGWAPYNETEHLVPVAQPIAVDCFNQTINEKTTQTIGSSASDVNHYGAVLEQKSVGALCARDYKGVGSQYVDEGKVITSPVTMAIRRLTPKECERLQGFPDDWTKIPYRNKPADQCPDGPRYKACGNSMAVPVMRWIGERIQMIENYLNPNL